VAERELAILLTARDRASKVVAGLDKKLDRLGRTGGRVFSGLRTGATRAGLALGAGIAGGVALGVRSLDELYRVQNQTNAVIESTGGVAGITTQRVRDLSNELENLTTADDKAIQSGANVILRYTRIGKEVFPRATKAATDMAIALAGGDVEAANFAGAAQLVGRALDDPIKGMARLRRQGVTFTKEQEKQVTALVKAGRAQEAQIVILRELEKRYGKAGEAAGKGPGAAWRRLQDTGEDLSQALAKGVLPALVKVSEWLNTKLADPRVTAELESLGEALGGMVEKGLAFVDKVDFKAVFAGVGVARDAAKVILSTFLSLPPWVQTAVVTGWGLNKLTGGALSGVVGELGKGLIRGVLGMNAGVVNINAGVVNGAGGGVPGVAGRGGGAGALATGARLVLPVGVAILVGELLAEGLRSPETKRRVALATGEAFADVNRSRGFLQLDQNGRPVPVGPRAQTATATPRTAGNTDPQASSRRLIPGIGDTRGELTGIRNAIRDESNRAARAVQIAERSGATVATKIDTTRSELVGIRQSQERRLADLAAVSRAAAGSTRSELAGIRSGVAAIPGAIRNIQFRPVFQPIINVPAPRVSITQIDRGVRRYYQYGNGGPVTSRVIS